MHVIATAGHVDHGKSTIVKALTGTDPDRLDEEKQRGLTIDLGFASMSLPSGREVAFVDVPGHVRFLKNMLAGISGVDACLFVVAAPEGWMPQSEEHLRILELLGVERGLVALTKVHRTDEDLVELARLDIAERTAGTFLSKAPVVDVDLVAGIGEAELVRALDDLLVITPTAADHGRPRLWIDRVFAAKGSGTVVTGTLTTGEVKTGDSMVVLPSGRTVRVRALQSFHRPCARIGPGHRVAINLAGVDRDHASRGDVVVGGGQWHTTTMVDAGLSVLASLEHALTRRGAYLAYVGSGEHPVRVRVLGSEAIGPGRTGPVRLYLRRPLPLVPGDRFILRESGRDETVGGGEILDIDPVLPAARARPDRSVERVIAERGHIDVDRLELLTGVRRAPDVGSWAVAPEHLEDIRARLAVAVARAGRLGLDSARLDDLERAVAATLPAVVMDSGRVRVTGGDDPLSEHPFVAAAAARPFSPPPPDGVDPGELRELVRRGALIEESGIYFAASAVDEASGALARLLAVRPSGVTVAEVRTDWGTTRKYTLALLARLDATGATRRRGDLRIAGPRLPDHCS